LGEEREDIAGDEDCGDPAQGDDGVGVAVCEEDDAREDHVDGCGEEGRGEEEKKRLHYVWSGGPFAAFFLGGEGAADVADEFNCLDLLGEVNLGGGEMGWERQMDGWRERLTDTADDKGNEVPCSRANQFEDVVAGGDAKESDEDDGCYQGGAIMI